MFKLPRSSWDDYDKSLISKGGGVFARSLKSIPLSPEVRALEIKAETVTPAELMTAILKAKAELLYLGGIGTYVKAKGESHADAGDKANDAVRVNGSDLRVKVVGEGANLGLTQAAASSSRKPAVTSTPTPSTTRPASTAPTTRSTSRS
jgi:glutamate dehydrogenase